MVGIWQGWDATYVARLDWLQFSIAGKLSFINDRIIGIYDALRAKTK